MAELSDDLKPCPFCGGDPNMAHNDGGPDDPNAGGYWIECTKCGASTNLRWSCGEDCRPMLIESWNRRAAITAAEAAQAQPAAPVQAVPGWLQSLCRYLSETLEAGTANERAVARTVMHLLPLAELTAGAAPVQAVPLTDGDKLWLWRDGPRLLAFRHEYPCFEPGGDPMTLGEPTHVAEFRSSHDRSAP